MKPVKLNTYPDLFRRVSTKESEYTMYRITLRELPDGRVVIGRLSGRINGVKTNNPVTVDSGVNLGKSNETSIREQANRVANTIFNKLLDQGYKTTIEEADTNRNNEYGTYLPMLAKTWSGKLEPNRYVFVQPKLDGARTLTKWDTYIRQYTRSAKPVLTLGHLIFPEPVIALLKQGMIIDGEAYIHGENFEDFVSGYKAYTEGLSERINYIVYDIFHPEQKLSQEYRLHLLEEAFEGSRSPNVFMLETSKALSVADIDAYYDAFVVNGYEGLMIRDPHGGYTPGVRSSSLLKYKKMQEDEFEIVGVRSARGKDEGTAIFTCKLSDGRTFDARPEGSADLRREYLNDGHTLIGKMATIQFQELTKYGLPRFPVFKAVRDYE